MTEYLILSLNRAVPLVWEYNREITFNLTFSRTFGSIPKSTLARTAAWETPGPGLWVDSPSIRLLRVFGTPPRPSIAGVKDISKPRLHKIGFTLSSWTGNPTFRIDLYYANPNGTPGQLITSFTPSIHEYGSGYKTVYVNFGDPPGAFSTGYELEWGTLYSIVLVPTFADGSNRGYALSRTGAGDNLVMRRIGYSTDGGSTWTLIDGYDWMSLIGVTVAYAFYYTADDVVIPMTKSSEAFRSYFNGWVSRTTLPSGIVVMSEDLNNIDVRTLTAGTEVPFTDAYVHRMTFYTTADVAGFTQTYVASFKWKYDINPVTVDMFYASEAYLQQIDFLASGTVRLNDSLEQEFSGNAGTSITFNPPILWWKLQVLSGSVRLKALVFE